jgi:hypothetical protein
VREGVPNGGVHWKVTADGSIYIAMATAKRQQADPAGRAGEVTY